MFSKETYINRRTRLKKAIGNGILLFLGNNESSMNYADNTYFTGRIRHFYIISVLTMPA